MEFEDDKVVTDNPYSRACAASCSDANAGPFRASAVTHTPLGKPIDLNAVPDAVCTSTGWGDGLYPVYIEYGDDGRVARLIVEFMENDKEWWDEEGFDSEDEAVDHYEEQEQDDE